MTQAADWRERFCGRQVELQRLAGAFERVARGGGPQLVVILGDRGMGKTRLAQEFYRRLAADYDPEHYWPHGLHLQGKNLRFAPDFRDPPTREHFGSFRIDERAMPYLWWGLRVSDPENRNAVSSDLAGHRQTLDPHLVSVMFARRLAAAAADIKQLGVDVGKSAALKAIEAVPVGGWIVGLALEAAEKGKQAVDALRERRRVQAEQASADLASWQRRSGADIQERTLADLAALMAPEAGLGEVPVVVFCDDAQFARAGGDEGTMHFLWQLWQRAQAGGWPLLLVATHWTLDWQRDVHGHREPKATGARFAAGFSLIADDPDLGEIIELLPGAELRDLVQAGLPQLGEHDATLLLAKADGNPQYLVELIDAVHQSPAWRTAGGALTDFGRKQIALQPTELTGLIVKRLQSEHTPPAVRLAVALASVQGMQFLCTLTDAASQALSLGSVFPALNDAESTHRLVVGVADGVASFVQRAYRDAASELVGSQLGDRQAIDAALLQAAAGFVDDATRWSGLSTAEQVATLGLLVGLGEQHADERTRLRAAQALIALARHAMSDGVRDYAQAASFAERWMAGLDRHWSLDAFGMMELDELYRAIVAWRGEAAGLALLERLLQRARSRAAEHRSTASLQHLLVMLVRAGASAQALGDAARASASMRESVTVGRALVELTPDDATRRELGVALRSLATTTDDDQEQAAALGEALDIFQGIHGSAATDDTRRDVSITLQLLGQMHLAKGAIDAAHAAHTAAAEGFFALTAQRGEGALDDWAALASALGDLGEVAVIRGDWPRAEAQFRKALEYQRAVADARATPECRRQVAALLERIALPRLTFDGDVDARASLREAVGMRRDLAATLATASSLVELADSLRLWGYAEATSGRMPEARQAYDEAIALLRQRLQSKAPLSRALLMECELLDLAAQAAAAAGDPADQLQRHRESLAAARNAVARLGSAEARKHLAIALGHAGEAACGNGQLDLARECYAEALQLFRTLAPDAPALRTRDVERDLLVTLIRAADVEQRGEHWQAALALLGDAATLARKRFGRNADATARDDLFASLTRLGDVQRARDDKRAAAICYREALASARATAAQEATRAAREDVGKTLTRIAVVEWQSTARDELRAMLLEAQGLLREAAQHSGHETVELGHVRQMLDWLDA